MEQVSLNPEKLPRVQKRVTDFFDYNIFDSGMDLPEARELVFFVGRAQPILGMIFSGVKMVVLTK